MKVKPILAMRRADGEIAYFLPDSTNAHTGAYLTFDDYLTKYAERHPAPSMSRCADPRCNRTFDAVRYDQKYCDAACNNRHRMRLDYRAANGLPLDEKPVDRSDEATQPYRNLIAALNLAKVEALARPVFKQEKDAQGRIILKSAETLHREELQATYDAKVAALPPMEQGIIQYRKFTSVLKQMGYELQDFGPGTDELDDLFQLWAKDPATLTKERIEAAYDAECYNDRLTYEREQREILARGRANLERDNDRVPRRATDPQL